MYFPVHYVIKEKNWYISTAGKGDFSSIKRCPTWVNPGTRGCQVPKGVVLAGSTKRDEATWMNIVEIGYEGDPIKVSLPYPVHAQAMVYDDDTKLLTVVGGRIFTTDETDEPQDEVHNPCRQVWQLKLFTKDSEWHSRPDLPIGVYDPVLLSKRGTLYVLGGYTNLTDKLTDGDIGYDARYDTFAKPKPEDGTKLCKVLGMQDKDWRVMKELKEHIDAPFGGAGVLDRGNILIINNKSAHKYEHVNDEWIDKDYEKITIYKCTPAVGPDNRVCAIAYYSRILEDKEEQSKLTKWMPCTSKSANRNKGKSKSKEAVGIIEYNFASNKWIRRKKLSLPNHSDLEVGAGRILSLQLLPEAVAIAQGQWM